MNKKDENNLILTNRPILLIANSSWYLHHYRSLLVKEISKNNTLFTMSPIDKHSKDISENSIYIPWNIYRSKDLNFLSLIISFLKMLLLVRAFKPKLIHSHTLKANLVSSIVSSLYGLPCVLSFTGMGRLSKSKGIKKLIFKIILNTIYHFSIRKRRTKWKWEKNKYRTCFIFQNPIDKEVFFQSTPKSYFYDYAIILGSGLPSKYLSNKKTLKNNWLKKENKKNLEYNQLTFIYCGRLLNSKGINVFLSLLNQFSISKGLVFGDIDPSSNDSLSLDQLNNLSKIHKNVSFKGNVKDPLLDINEKYPILVVPSVYGEGLSRSIIEGLSLKIPIICSSSSLRGVFSEEYLFSAQKNDHFTYKQKVHELLQKYHDDQISKMLEKGYQEVIENFTEEKVVQTTIKMYDKLLSQNNSSYLIKNQKYKESFWLSQ
tara:strand:- start:9788 stop:11077 length:1290 start_codon:yes stop_codon:yes gene_type:complete